MSKDMADNVSEEHSDHIPNCFKKPELLVITEGLSAINWVTEAKFSLCMVGAFTGSEHRAQAIGAILNWVMTPRFSLSDFIIFEQVRSWKADKASISEL